MSSELPFTPAFTTMATPDPVPDGANPDLYVEDRRLASTVLLLRDRVSGPGVEVYVHERANTMSRFPEATVFPGGGVDAMDLVQPHPEMWEGPGATWWAQQLGCSQLHARALVLSAVREVFEESGFLLAVDRDGQMISDATKYAQQRAAMERHELGLADFLLSEGLRIRSTMLRPFARWQGPPPSTRQFDTFSFAVAWPQGHDVVDPSGEATSAGWFRPELLLDGWEAGLVRLVVPTWNQLRRLCEFDSVSEVMALLDNVRLQPETGLPVQDPRYLHFHAVTSAKRPKRF